MIISEIHDSVKRLALSGKFTYKSIFDLLIAYGISKSYVTRLKRGEYNHSNDENTVLAKNKLYYKYNENEDLHLLIDSLRNDEKVDKLEPRFIVVSDGKQLLSIDTETDETLDINIKDLHKSYEFFLPWAGMEKTSYQNESIADIKAARKMAKIYDEIININPYPKEEYKQADYQHNLNLFFSRLLFCLFAEDTDVFEASQFTNAIASYTQENGSDLQDFIQKLFKKLSDEDEQSDLEHLNSFPYVNGGLFAKQTLVPKFNRTIRRLIIECGELDWAQINPDIFGSMMQAVVHPSQREHLGMHYTSVANIMKVIEPLFLDELKAEYEKAEDSESKLEKLLKRISQIKIFDPACGSGNFLIIAYKELRKLEHKILKRQSELKGGLQLMAESKIPLENFYGIEIDDFAAEIATLSLWLAKHQMNIRFKELFGIEIPLIPLKDSGNIVCENAARVDWELICPTNSSEVYLIGNPPYLGSRNQDKAHKADKQIVIGHLKGSKKLDYVAIWFDKGGNFIRESNNAKLAFVSTNSIIQGEQVPLLWPYVLEEDLEIGFAHKSFKWSNNATHNAGVSVVIISLQKKSNDPKELFDGSIKNRVKHINSYLLPTSDIYFSKRTTPLSKLPEMSYGNYTGRCNELIMTETEKESLLKKYPGLKKIVRPYIGASEFLKGTTRFCLWIEDNDLDFALSHSEIKEKIRLVKKSRLSSRDDSMKKLAKRPHQFRDMRLAQKSSLIIPIIFSEKRQYLTVDLLDSEVIIPNSAQVIFDPELYIFGLLSSTMHMLWIRATSGGLETRIRYSSTIVYNNFPVPPLSDKQKEAIENNVYEIIGTREQYPERTLAELYDPDEMPADLLEAHHRLDEVVERCYRERPFKDDEERLSHLFKLYEKMTNEEKEA